MHLHPQDSHPRGGFFDPPRDVQCRPVNLKYFLDGVNCVETCYRMIPLWSLQWRKLLVMSFFAASAICTLLLNLSVQLYAFLPFIKFFHVPHSNRNMNSAAIKLISCSISVAPDKTEFSQDFIFAAFNSLSVQKFQLVMFSTSKSTWCVFGRA